MIWNDQLTPDSSNAPEGRRKPLTFTTRRLWPVYYIETEESGIGVWKFTVTPACSVLGHKRTD